MTTFKVLILGSSSALPTLKGNPTSQLINVNESYYLIDCGEGTQVQLRKFKIKFQRIKAIFISHLHGDHYLGLFGLLQSMHLLGRVSELQIYAPPKLKELIDLHLAAGNSKLCYPLKFISTNGNVSEQIYEDKKIKVDTIPLNHRIPCSGFKFTEQQLLKKINIKAIQVFDIPTHALQNIKKGQDYTSLSGKVYKNEDLTLPPKKPRQYAFCSDTSYFPSIIPYIKGVDVLYHEATFTEEHKERATKTFHSTAKQAAEIAKEAQVGLLLIGHFSHRYSDFNLLLNEAKGTFDNTLLATQGEVFDL